MQNIDTATRIATILGPDAETVTDDAGSIVRRTWWRDGQRTAWVHVYVLNNGRRNATLWTDRGEHGSFTDRCAPLDAPDDIDDIAGELRDLADAHAN